jgi:Transcriptional regulators
MRRVFASLRVTIYNMRMPKTPRKPRNTPHSALRAPCATQADGIAAAPRPHRSDAKFADAADILRRDIVRGIWKPGERLPTWDALCERLDIQRPTLRRTLSILKAEGFIEAAPTRATHVHSAPPHLTRYALLFPSTPQRRGPSGWNLYWDALAVNAPLIAKELGVRIDIHYDVSTHPDCAAYANVMADHAKRRIAGILAVRGGDLGGIVPKKSAQTPIVHISAGNSPADNAPSVWFDWASFNDRAADILLSRGCRSIAVLADTMGAASISASVLAAKGARIQPKWTLTIPGYLPDLACNLARLLVADPADRPDALLITDDNLVAPACDGIAKQGISMPGDILVLSHCNWPAPGARPDVLRLGFSARDSLLSALKLCSVPFRPSEPFPSIALQPTGEYECR